MGLPKLHCPRHDTHPIVVHAAGLPKRRHRIFAELCDLLFSQSIEFPIYPPSSTYQIITWSNQPEPTILERCCALYGSPITVLRPEPGEPWQNRLKLRLTKEHLVKPDSPPITIGLDATDCLLLGDPFEIINRWIHNFRRSNQAVFAAERNSYPPGPELSDVYDNEEKAAFSLYELPWCHLNSGCFVGSTEYLARLYAAADAVDPCKRRPDSDQGCLRKIYLDWPEVVLDRRWQIFSVPTGRYDETDCLVIERERNV